MEKRSEVMSATATGWPANERSLSGGCTSSCSRKRSHAQVPGGQPEEHSSEETGEIDMAIQMAPPESSGSGRGSSQEMRRTAKEPRKYIAFSPPKEWHARYT